MSTSYSTPIDPKALNAFLKANPTIDLKTFPFLKEEKVKTLQWTECQQNELLPQLKGLQRLLHLTDQATAQKLYNAGIHSCFQIARLSKSAFVKKYEPVFKDNTQQAVQIWQHAQSRASQLTLHHVALQSDNSAHYQALRHSNLSPKKR